VPLAIRVRLPVLRKHEGMAYRVAPAARVREMQASDLDDGWNDSPSDQD
jgi:hypothetical protein